MIKVLFIFALIIFLSRRKWPMGPILLLASFILGCCFHLNIKEVLCSIGNSAKSLDTIYLSFIIVLVLTLSKVMKEGGQLERIVSAFRNLGGKDCFSLVAFPSLIGLLPMIGGAIFSAPMVEEASQKTKRTAEEKAAANYWFRHIWEYWWPLYPGVILTIALTKIDLGTFIVRQFPLTLVALISGFFLILRRQKEKGEFNLSFLKKFIFEISPIFLVIFLVLIFKLGLKFPQNPSLLIALIISISWVTLINRISFPKIRQISLDKVNFMMFILGVGIMVFKGMLHDTQALIGIKENLSTWNIPSLPIIMFLPFLSGLITGLSVGFVGASFPLVISLLPGAPKDYLQYIILAYGWGYAGVLLSPVHICLILTKDYFQANLAKIYARVFPLIVIMLGAVFLLFFLYGGI